MSSNSFRPRLVTQALRILALSAFALPITHAATISGGTATWTINEGFSDALGWLDANFSESMTRAQTLDPASVSDAYYHRISGSSGTLGTSTENGYGNSPGQVQVGDSIRPFGEVPLNDAGGTTPGQVGVSRTRQATTLNFDPSNILGTWSTSNDGYGIFVGNSILGEQIAFTDMQRWGGPFTGVLVYGDFALRYTGTKLVLTSNIDFLHAAFAEIGSPVISYVGDANNGTLTITGDLLVAGGLSVLDPSSVVGTNFGTFSMTASVVPEPSASTLILFCGGLIFLIKRFRKTLGNVSAGKV